MEFGGFPWLFKLRVSPVTCISDVAIYLSLFERFGGYLHCLEMHPMSSPGFLPSSALGGSRHCLLRVHISQLSVMVL